MFAFLTVILVWAINLRLMKINSIIISLYLFYYTLEQGLMLAGLWGYSRDTHKSFFFVQIKSQVFGQKSKSGLSLVWL